MDVATVKPWRKLVSIICTLAMVVAFYPGLTVNAQSAYADESNNVAQIGETQYATLADAVEAAKSGDTITLLSDASGSGIKIDTSQKNLTIDFDGYTYTVNSDPLAGSTNTKSQCFQLLTGGSVTMKNGTIKADNSGVAMIIQNYCDLTLDGMTIDGASMTRTDATTYALSNNCGNITIKDTTITAEAGDNNYAFDVYGGSGNYSDVTVTVTGTSVINGTIEVARKANNESNANNNTLLIEDGATVNGDVSVVQGTSVTVNGATIKGNVTIEDGSSAAVTVLDSTVTGAVIGSATIINSIVGGEEIDEQVVDGVVALVNGVTYTTLSDAMNAAKDNGTVILLANATDVVIPADYMVTLDLNNCTISSSSDHAITNEGTLIITGEGTVDGGDTNSRGALYNAPSAAATLNGGTFISSTWYVIQNKGALTINDGVTMNKTAGTSGSGIDNIGTANQIATLTINGGSFTSNVNATIKNDDYGELTITGGTFESTNGAVVQNANIATISGGSFTKSTSEGYVLYNSGYTDGADGQKGELTVTGGTYVAECDGTTLLGTFPLDKYEGNYSNGTVTISGGEFTGTFTTEAAIGNVEASITGGTYSSDVSEYVAANNTIVKNEDGTYSIETGTEDAVAEINGVGFGTLESAIAAAKDGATVTLLTNVTLNKTQAISSSLTIDLNGKTITSPEGDIAFSCNTASEIVVKNGAINGYQGFYCTAGTLVLTDITLTTTGRCIDNYDSSTVTIDTGSVVKSTGYTAIVVWGWDTFGDESCKTPTLNVYGTVESENGWAVSTNGTDYSQPVINIYDGASLTSAGAAGMYIPNAGAVNIYGGTITGYSAAVAIKCGTLNISGGTLTAVGPDATPTEGYSNGVYASGAAIQIESNDGYKVSKSEPGKVIVNITGGEIVSENGYAIYEYIGAETKDGETKALATDTHLSSMTISGDTAVSGAKGALLISEELSNKETDPIKISGGKFSSSVADHVVETLTAELISSSDTTTPYSYYASLADAIEAAKDGDTVKLLADSTENVTIPKGATITLDLNGKTISTSGNTINNKGTLTVKDSSEPSTGKLVSTESYCIYANTGSTTTIESGTIESVEGAVITGTSTGATINIKGGTLKASDNAVVAGNGTNTNREGEPNTINISGGTIGGSITTDGYVACGVYAPWKDTINITGGTINITGGAGVVARAGNVSISDKVTITTTGNATGKVGDSRVVVPCSAIVYDSEAGYPAKTEDSKITVTGGNFTSESGVDAVTNVGDDVKVEISGGTYSSDVNDYVVAGNRAVQNDDGTYSIQVDTETAVAEVNGVGYTTLSDAINAVKEGETVKLLNDLDLEATQEIYTSVTIALNGKTITGNNVRALWVKSGTLTLTGSGTVTTVAAETDTIMESSSVIRVGDANTNANASGLVIEADVSIKAPATYGVTVFGKNADLTLDVKGTIEATGNASAISGNGSKGLTATTITIESGAVISATTGVAIYQPQEGTLTIKDGASITAIDSAGIVARSGNVTIEGGTISAGGEGTHTVGDSTIGTIDLPKSAVVYDFSANYPGSTEENAKLTITGGSFSAAEDVATVSILPEGENKGKVTITDGTFLSGSNADENVKQYLAEGLTLDNGGKVITKEQAETQAVIDQIDALPAPADVTTDDKEAIEDARKAYAALTDEQQKGVTNIDKLKNDEKVLSVVTNIEELEAKVEELTEKLENAASKDDVEALQTQIEELKTELANVQTANDTQDEKIASLTTDVETLQTKADQLASDLEAAEARITELETQVEQLTEDLAKAASKEEVADLQAKIEELKTELADVQTANDTQQEKIDSLTTDVKSLQDKADKLASDLEAAEKRITELEAKVEELTEKLENAASKDDVADLQTKIEELQTELASVNASSTAQQEEINALTNALQDASDKITALENSTVDLKEYEGLEETIRNLRGSVNTIKLSTTTFTYNGKVKKPKVTVVDPFTDTVVDPSNYTVTFKGNKVKPGIVTVKVTFRGNTYHGTQTKTYKILPKKTKITKSKAKKKQITIKYKKSPYASGYQIAYHKAGTSNKFKTTTKTSVTVKKLKKGTKYYFKVRAYKKVNGKKYYGKWSNIKLVKTKK